jgi:hypothetical protein
MAQKKIVVHVHPSGPIPPAPSSALPSLKAMASGHTPPPADGAPMADPAKEAAQHAPKNAS